MPHLSRAGAILVAAIIAGWVPALSSAAAEPSTTPRTIIVTGEGEARAKPDQARLTAGVVTQAQSASSALAANNAAMSRIFAALRMQGIPEAKIQTSNLSVQPQSAPFRNDNPQPRTIANYQVSDEVAVTVDDVANLGMVVDAVMKNGANELQGIAFTFADPKPLLEMARRNAVSDAMAKARTLASAAGVTLGPLIQLQETGNARPLPVARLAVAAAASTPIAAGEQSVTVNVTMTYEIR